MYFLVNVSLFKPLDVATSNFVSDLVALSRGYWATPRVTYCQIMYIFVNASPQSQ